MSDILPDGPENEPRDLSRERNRPEREQRAEAIRSAREGTAAALEEDRVARAQQLAIEAALQKERTERRFVDIERQLAAINGSVRQAAVNYSALNTQLGEVKQTIGAMHSNQEKRDAIASALKNAVEKANESQISNRMFISGVMAIIVTILGIVISQGHLFA